MKKKALLLAIVGLLAFPAGGLTAVSATPKQPVTLRLMDNAQDRFGWDVIVANFQRVYPNIKIETTFVDSQTYPTLLLTQLQAGSGPDIFLTQLGNGSAYAVYPLSSQGKLLDLSGSPWVKRVQPTARKFASRQHKIYAFPAGYNLQGLMYNKDLFASLGLTEPKTFNELLALCGKIKAAGKIPISAGFASLNAQIQMLQMMMVAFVYSPDPDWTLKRIQKKVTFAGTTAWQTVLDDLVRMNSAGCFPPSPAAVTQSAQYGFFTRGDAVMMPASSQELPLLHNLNPNLKLAHMPGFPGVSASDTVVGVSAAALNVVGNAQTQHPKEVRMFIDFVARPKQSALWAKVQGVVAGSDLKAGTIPAYTGATDSLVRLAKAGKVITAPPTGWIRSSLFNPQFITQIPGLFTGQRTPMQILQFMDQQWDGS